MCQQIWTESGIYVLSALAAVPTKKTDVAQTVTYKPLTVIYIYLPSFSTDLKL